MAALVGAKRALLSGDAPGRGANWRHPKAVWAANFVTGQAGPEGAVSVTRASDHLLAGRSSPVLTFGPNTLARANGGAYIGGQRTNMFTTSTDFSSWQKDFVDLVAGGVVPGGATATFVRPTAANNVHRIFQTRTIVIGGTYALSVIAKAGGYRYFSLNSTTANGGDVVFDLLTGAVQTYAGAGFMEPLADGWWRCWSIGQALGSGGTTDGFPYMQVHKEFSNTASAWSYAGDGVSGIYLWGAQLEPTFRTPPILSGATSGVRQASDVRAASFGWFSSSGLSSGFSVLGTINTSHLGDAVARSIASLGTAGSLNSRLTLGLDATDKATLTLTDGAGADVVSLATTAIGATGRVKVAGRFAPGAYRLAATGKSAAGSAAGTALPSVAGLFLGQRPDQSAFLNDVVEQLQICRPLSDGEMDAWVAA